MNNAIDQFQAAIAGTGLTPPDTIRADGALHRFSSNGKRADDSGWYVLHAGDVPAGAFGCWRSGMSETWRADIGRELTDEERREYRNRQNAMKQARQKELHERQAKAQKRASEIWNESTCTLSHPYLSRKNVGAFGLRLRGDLLVVPMRDEWRHLTSLQFIKDNGTKRFLSGGRVVGCYHLIGEPAGMLCVVEGYATGATIHQLTKQAVAVAFNADNLLSVAEALRRRYRTERILIFADNDHKTEGNPGVTKAREAAAAVGGMVAIPECGEGTDFNDMAK